MIWLGPARAAPPVRNFPSKVSFLSGYLLVAKVVKTFDRIFSGLAKLLTSFAMVSGQIPGCRYFSPRGDVLHVMSQSLSHLSM